jgi:succinoglycan biosynthesis transport protein ExoP
MRMSLGAHLARIRSRWFLVVAITLLAGLVALGASERHAGTHYTGTATIVTQSASASPDQVGVLASGYVDTFIQPSYQDTLRAAINLPADVTLTAQTAAASPIIYISATAPDQATAQLGAKDAASQFIKQVNDSLAAGRQSLIEQMQQAVKADTKATSGAIRVPAEIDMQDRINGVNADPTNSLQMLQANAGVTAAKSGFKKVVGESVVAGLILGCLLAWVMGAASRRLSSPAEVAEKARIEPLVVIPAGGGEEAELQRERKLRQLATSVALLDLPKPAVIAVTPVEQTPADDEIAARLARYRADHGVRTILVHADGAPTPFDAVEGDIEPVGDGWLLVSRGSAGALREVFLVSDPRDMNGLLGIEHLRDLVDSLRSRADLIVIQTPVASESPESYMVCAVADRTLLLAGAGSSADALVAVRDQLERGGVSLLGVAFVERQPRREETGRDDRTVPLPLALPLDQTTSSAGPESRTSRV